ncbi:MAG: OmpA family protein [Bacteroidetes bacterium]|nr:OmpA family protein [Bacteroidota bacterium]
MNRIVITLLSCLLLAGSAFAQDLPFSGTKNKKAEYQFGEALKAFQEGDGMKALNFTEKAITYDPNFIDAYMLKAEIKSQNERYSDALEIYQKIKNLNPEFPMSYYGTAKILYTQKQYDEALVNAKRFLEYPDHFRKGPEMQRIKSNIEFAIQAIKNPVPFQPVNMGPSINSYENEYFPGITSDGQTFIFTRLEGGRNEEFYLANKRNNEWLPAMNLGAPINTERNEGTVSLSADGQYIFYTACNKPGGLGSCDLYLSKLDGLTWAEPKNLGAPVNSSAWESQPSVSFDGKTVYFSSNRPGGYGGSDIWYTTFKNGRWSPPVNMGPEINTTGEEQSPFIAKDDNTLYFNSNGHAGMGGIDLFVARKVDGRWQKPKNMGYPINTDLDETCLVIASNGTDAYIARQGADSYGGLDIYQFELNEDVKPAKTGYVKGTVFDAETLKKLSARVELIDLATGKSVVESYSNKASGEFLVSLQGNKDYALNVSAENYLFYSENFALKNQSATEPLELKVPLQPIKAGSKVVLKNIFFDTDKFTLKEESKVELEKLIQFLNANPKVRIEIGGHTDNTGDPKKNSTLSTNRAKAVLDYLVSKQIAANRLTSKGYAETQPISDNKTAEGRQQNRRTEFKILP